MDHFKSFSIEKKFFKALKIITIVPAFDEPKLLQTIQSLHQCKLDFNALVLVFINASSNAPEEKKEQNRKNSQKIIEFIEKTNSSRLKIAVEIDNHLPPKKAGVGMARKIAMDFASHIFKKSNFPQGIITSLDGDCLVSQDYFSKVFESFTHNKLNGASINFLHQNVDHSQGIRLYEIFLRLHLHFLRKIGFQNIYHTIGSCFAVTQHIYEKSGGMNTRKAGEDFYFVNKIIPYNHFRHIPDILVFPSSRPSERVPFGTGKAIGKWELARIPIWYSYSTKVYQMLHYFHQEIVLKSNAKEIQNALKNLPKPLQSALFKMKFPKMVQEIEDNTNSSESFQKHMSWKINGFFLLKLSHHLRDDYFPNTPLLQTAKKFLQKEHLNEQQIHKALMRLDQKSYLFLLLWSFGLLLF